MMCTVPTSNGFAGIRTVEIPETELLLDILAGTADGAFAVDENHRIAFWNESAAKILGFSSTEATGRLCYELVGGSGRGRRGHLLSAVPGNHGGIDAPLPSQLRVIHSHQFWDSPVGQLLHTSGACTAERE